MVKFFVLFEAIVGTIGMSQITIECTKETLLTPKEVIFLMNEAKTKVSALVKKETGMSVPLSMIEMRFLGFVFKA